MSGNERGGVHAGTASIAVIPRKRESGMTNG